MGKTCSLVHCNKGSDTGPKRGWYSIPAIITHQGEIAKNLSEERRRLWLAIISRRNLDGSTWVPTKNSFVCSDHFVSGRPSPLFEKTHLDWTPSLKLDKENLANEALDCSVERFVRVKARTEKTKTHVAATSLLDLSKSMPHDDAAPPTKGVVPLSEQSLDAPQDDVGAQDGNSDHDQEWRKQMRDAIQHLTSENIKLRQSLLEGKIIPESFENDDEKVKYYTGLPGFLTLMSVFQLVEPYITTNFRSPLTKFQKLMVVLCRLRLNLPLQDLAYRFDVSNATMSRVFCNVIHVMYVKLNPFILWPDREQLQITMSMEFRKHFGVKVAIVIDCFEICIERPSNLLARAETWSSYKHHNTVKFLIGITPQGSVSFVSKAWGGRCSDKYITEHCGLLDKLIPGDVVLPDRGFDIAESVGLVSAELKIPAFAKGKKQLSLLEVESTRKIAHVRIHVERIIGLVRNKYTILRDTLSIDMMKSEGSGVATALIVTAESGRENSLPTSSGSTASVKNVSDFSTRRRQKSESISISSW